MFLKAIAVAVVYNYILFKRQYAIFLPFDAHCCHMGTAIKQLKHSVQDVLSSHL